MINKWYLLIQSNKKILTYLEIRLNICNTILSKLELN